MTTAVIDRKKWLADRKHGIGGSDASAICGINPYMTKTDVYMDKLNISDELETNLAMRFGTSNEPFLANEYLALKGDKFSLREPKMTYSDEYPFMFANIDRILYNGNATSNPICGVEIKTTNVRNEHLWGEQGTDQIPEIYNVQCQHYMAVRPDLAYFDVVVLVGGSDLRIYRVERNPELITTLIRIEKEFWEKNVLLKVAPEIDHTESSKQLLSYLHPKDNSQEIEADEKAVELAIKYLGFDNLIKDLTIKKDKHKNLLKEIIGDNRKLSHPDFHFIWSTSKDGTNIDWESIVKELAPSKEIIDRHTTLKNGVRSFRSYDHREKV